MYGYFWNRLIESVHFTHFITAPQSFYNFKITSFKTLFFFLNSVTSNSSKLKRGSILFILKSYNDQIFENKY